MVILGSQGRRWRLVPQLLVSAALVISGPVPGAQPPDLISKGGPDIASARTASAKVVSWNIARGLRLAEITQFLERQNASLFVLQEVDVNSNRTEHKNIADELARSLRMPYLFAAEFEELAQGSKESPAYHGQATMSSLAASSPRLIRFEHQTSFWKPRWYLPNWPALQRRKGGRLALVAEIDLGGRPLVVYNVHLESRESEQLRKLQIEEILADTARYPAGTPILIAGDLNTREDLAPAVEVLLQAGFRVAVGRQITTPRGYALDWILIRGPLTAEQGMVHRDIDASDHYPLSVVVHLNLP